MPEPTPLAPLPIPPPAEPHARDRDACAACHSPLNPDARYCLRCGARRAGTRLEALDLLDERPDHAPAAAPLAAPPSSRLDAPRTWPFGLTAVVLLALLIGLVAGHYLSDRDDGGRGTAATQVIRVEGAAASTAAPATTAGATSAAPATTADPVTAP